MRQPRQFARGRALALFLFLVFASCSDWAFAEDPNPLRIHCLSGSKEYQSEPSLKILIAELERRYRGITCTASWGKDKGNSLDYLEALRKADLMIVFCRRQNLPEEQMAIIRSHYESGKPVLGIRTASHPFQEKDNEHFDRVVLGNNYDGHYGNDSFEVKAVEGQKDHPVLRKVGPFKSRRLYKARKLAPATIVLQTGDIGKGAHPLTILHVYKKGRTFYTSLGVPEDFKDPNFLQLLRNAVFWTTAREEKAYRKAP